MQYTKGYRFRAVMGVIFKLIEAVFELILPLLMVQLVDQGMRLNDYSFVVKIAGLMAVMTLLGYGSSLLCQYNAAVVSQGIGGRLRKAVMEKINTFSFVEIDEFGSATLANRIIVDVNQIQLMIAMAIRLAVRTPILMAGSIFAIASLNAELAIWLLVSFPIFIVVVALFMALSMRNYKKMQEALDRLVAKTREVLSGIRIIRGFSKTERERQNLKKTNHNLDKRTKHLGLSNSLSGPVTMLMMNLVMVLLIYRGAFHVNEGVMTQGQMVAVINYCTQLVLTLVVFMNLVITFSRGIASSYRVKEVLTTTPSIQNTKNPIQSLPQDITLRFENVSFSYPDEQRRILSNVSFVVNAGERVGFIGLTGSGKSTIMSLLLRYYDVSEGAIYLNDIDIREIDLHTLRKAIGFATQTSDFISSSLDENIAMNRNVDTSDALRKAEGAEILNKGLDSQVASGGKNLSGGQRQRVNIARALAGNPSILILDDSLSALDYLTDKRLRENLEVYYEHTSTLIISQRTTSLMSAKTIFVIADGRLQDAGNHETLLKRNELYQAIHATQVKEAV